MSEALEWLRESLCDALEDFESDDSCEGIPLVPIMDYALNAMDNDNFKQILHAVHICEPFDEQVCNFQQVLDVLIHVAPSLLGCFNDQGYA